MMVAALDRVVVVAVQMLAVELRSLVAAGIVVGNDYYKMESGSSSDHHSTDRECKHGKREQCSERPAFSISRDQRQRDRQKVGTHHFEPGLVRF